jgi:hypothetical protein
VIPHIHKALILKQTKKTKWEVPTEGYLSFLYL